VAFEDILASAPGRAAGTNALRPVATNAAHIAGRPSASAPGTAAPEVIRAEGTSLRNDGNNVDIESEMALLAENSLTAALVDHTIAKLNFFRDIGVLQVRPDGMWEENKHD